MTDVRGQALPPARVTGTDLPGRDGDRRRVDGAAQAVRPVLVLHPAEDRMTDIEFTRRIVHWLGDRARLVVLDGCGHFPVEEPGARVLNEHLVELLRRLA